MSAMDSQIEETVVVAETGETTNEVGEDKFFEFLNGVSLNELEWSPEQLQAGCQLILTQLIHLWYLCVNFNQL